MPWTPPQNEIAEAAASVFRYFSEALPLHEADENQSLFPRLHDALPLGALLREAAETMVEQHKAIDELVAELLSLCGHHPPPARAAAQPLAPPAATSAAALDQIFAAHLHLEETVIFPALQQLLPRPKSRRCRARCSSGGRRRAGTIHLVQ